MNGLDRAIISAMAREQMEKEAALGIGKAYQSAVSSAGKYLAPKWKYVADAGKWLGTMGGRVTPESSMAAQLGSHAARVGAGAGIGAAAGAVSSKDRKRGAIKGALIGGLGAGVLPYALKTTHQTGEGMARLVSRPIHTMRGAWRGMGRTFSKAEKAKLTPAQLEEATNFEKTLADKAKADPGLWTRAKARLKGITPEEQRARQLQHLYAEGAARTPTTWGEAWQQGQGLGKVRELAGEASRRGWTGQGGVTKYLPGGGKGLTAIFAGMSAPTIYRSATGDIPLSEGLGEIGSNVGYLAAAGMPGSTFVTPLLMGELAARGVKAPVQWFEDKKRSAEIPDAIRQQLEAQRGRFGKVLPQAQQAINRAGQQITRGVQQ